MTAAHEGNARVKKIQTRARMWILLSCLTWTPMWSPRPMPVTYRIENEVAFWDDRLLPRDVSTRAAVRRALDSWEHVAPTVRFVEAEHGARADVRFVTVPTLSEEGRSRILAQVHGDTVQIANDVCWYTDPGFCEDILPWQPLFLMAWGVSFVTVGVLVCQTPTYPTLRLVAWTGVFAPPLLYWGALVPCVHCYDFVATMVHEAGHLLGLGHPDEGDKNRCGCGGAARACNATRTAVMHSDLQRRTTSCPQPDDANGARSLYAPHACADPVWCYETHEASGVARVAVAAVLGFALAWAVVSVRHVWHTMRARKKQKQQYAAMRAAQERARTRALVTRVHRI